MRTLLFLSMIAVSCGSCNLSQIYYYEILKEYNGVNLSLHTMVHSYQIRLGPIADHTEYVDSYQSIVQAKEKSVLWAQSTIKDLKQADSILNAQP